MKHLLWLATLLPFYATAQINGTLQKTVATKTIRGSFGSSGIDSLVSYTGSLTNGYILQYNSTSKKWDVVANPGNADSLEKKANRTFDNVASGAIAQVKVSGLVSDLAGKVPTSRTIIAGNGLSGGGDLSANRTFSVDTTAIRTVANSVSLAGLQTRLNLKANLASPTFTGNLTVASNSLSSSTNGLYQAVSDDYFKQYAYATTTDRGEYVFETGDNGLPWASNGQRWRYSYNAGTSGVAKDVLLIDYDAITTPNDLTALSFTGEATGLTGMASSLSIGGNAVTATSAATLTTTRTIWGQNFNGSANVSGAISGATTINASGRITGLDFAGDNLYVPSGGALFFDSGVSNSYSILKSGTGLNYSTVGNHLFGGTGTLGSAWQGAFGNGAQYIRVGANPTAAEIQSTGGVPLYLNYGGNAVQVGSVGSPANLTINGSVSASNLTSGTYTPTFTGILNITSATAPIHQYTRIGDLVTIYGRVSITPTAFANTSSEIEFTLPVSSNMTLVDDLFGVVSETPSATNINLNADVTNDRAQISFNAQASSISIIYSLRYLIK